jgi:hypothetical protein
VEEEVHEASGYCLLKSWQKAVDLLPDSSSNGGKSVGRGGRRERRGGEGRKGKTFITLKTD